MEWIHHSVADEVVMEWVYGSLNQNDYVEREGWISHLRALETGQRMHRLHQGWEKAEVRHDWM